MNTLWTVLMEPNRLYAVELVRDCPIMENGKPGKRDVKEMLSRNSHNHREYSAHGRGTCAAQAKMAAMQGVKR